MERPNNSAETLRISKAAARLGLSREATIRRVLRGELDGDKDEDGNWVVTVKSVADYERAGA